MNDPKVGIINEQGYFGTGFGFNEAVGEDAEKAKEELRKKDENKDLE